jgi:hypothetical protein
MSIRMARLVAAWAEWAAWICNGACSYRPTVVAIKKERTLSPLFFFAAVRAAQGAAELKRPLTRLDLSDSISVLWGPAAPVDQ